jgi:hypothetical protein
MENPPHNQHPAKWAEWLYETFPVSQVTDDMMIQAANLFRENYGIWGKQSKKPQKMYVDVQCIL